MKRARALLRYAQRKKPKTTGLTQTVGRPSHTVRLRKRDFELLRKRGFTDQLAPRYFKGIEIGTIVRIEQLFIDNHKQFCLARLETHPNNPFMRAYTRKRPKSL